MGLHCLRTTALWLACLCLFAGPTHGDQPAAMAVAVPAAANQNEAMLLQFQEQLRPVLRGELSFIRLMCDLPEAQRPKVKTAGEAGLKKAAQAMVDQQQPMRRVVAVNMTTNDPRKIIREGLAQSLRQTLTPEQMARYEDELAKRSANRKRAAIMSAVARLDDVLFLTAQQREAIIDSISSNWQDDWEQWLMMQRYGHQYFPQIPEQRVAPHLNDKQRAVWHGLQKVNFGGWGGWDGQEQLDDGWWGKEPEKPAKPVELNLRQGAR